MKRQSIFKKFFLMILSTLFVWTMQAQTTVFEEHFNNVTDSSGSDISSQLNLYTTTTGWTGNKVYQSNGKVKLGTASVLGYLVTPAINLSGNSGNFTLSFDAEAWYHDSTTIKVYVGTTVYPVSGLENNGSYGSYNHFSLNLAGGTATTNIRFEGNQAAKGRFFLDNIVITQNGSITPTTAMPTFSPAGGIITTATNVTIECATANATIYYTTDGTTPTNTSTLYASPIAISQTTTLKAIAYATGYNNSNVTTATYTFPVTVANIAAFKAANSATNNTPYNIAGNVTFAFQSGNYTFVQDTSAGLMMFGGTNDYADYSEGDVISGGIIGTYSLYHAQVEFVPTTAPAASTSNTGNMSPTLVTIADLTANYAQYDAKLIRLQNVTIEDGLTHTAGSAGIRDTIVQNGNRLIIYNRFNTLDTTIAANTITDVVGFAGIYDSQIQIYPRSNADLIAATPVTATPVITASGNATGTPNAYYLTASVALSSTTTGASIYYTTDGTTPTSASTLYTTPFDITATSTINAIATKTGYTNSAVATKTITIAQPTVETPVIVPCCGVYADSVTFSITCGTEGATIRYTTDGSEPTETSTLYTTPVTIYSTTTVKAKAFKTDWLGSLTVASVFTIAHSASLTVSPTALTFNSTILSHTISVSGVYLTAPIILNTGNTHFTLSEDTIAANAGNTTITITFDGTEPANSILSLTSDTLSAQVTLTASATLPAPTFTPATGTSDTVINVSIASTIANTEIHYTTDGTAPTAAATLYTAPITLNIPGTYTVKAIAMKSGWDNSIEATATYTVVSPTPQFNDSVVYYTGFESTDGFTATSVYNNTTEAVSGSSSTQWATTFGTPSTTAPISGAQSMQMRWYAATAASLGYTRTDFDVQHATRVQFLAASTNGLLLAVSHSTDGGVTYSTPTNITLTSTKALYNYVVSQTGQYDNVRFKFQIVLPETAPTATSRIYLDSVSIFAIPGLPTTTVSTPVISPNGGNVSDTVHVSISCPTTGAQIYYTTDGTTPTESSTLYTTPFTITTSTTVKAKAFKFGYTASNVATNIYNFPTEVANIAAFKAANTATNTHVYKITGNVTFTYRNGRNIYVQDTTGGLLLYDQSNLITTTYNEGDVISGGISGTYTLYSGLVEMIPTANTAASTQNTGNVVPEVVTVEAIEAHYNWYESKLIKIENATFTAGGTFTTAQASNLDIAQNGETMQCRNVFKTLDMTIPANYQADITGLLLQYNGTYQIAPRTNSDIVGIVTDTVATPTFHTDYDDNPICYNTDSLYVTIQCETPGATIYYTIDNTDPTTNSNVFSDRILLTVGTWKVKAFATKEGMYDSPVATIQLCVGNGIADYSDQVSVYPNPATNSIVVFYNNLNVKQIELYSMMGQLLQRVEANEGISKLSLDNQTPGMYIVKLIGDDFTAVKKICKK